jgi:RNA polymerase sigma factor (sigma-70 family)
MSQGNDLLQHLRAHGLRLKAETESDGDLLARFLDRRDESAFEGLVARLGPMVWSVCRRVLPDAADAEDAFQATFVVLVRKGQTVNPRDRVGNWLYGVAYHAARKVRVDRARRHEKEQRAAAMAETHTVDPHPTADLAAHVDREVARLPAKYRAPVVLCDLEGKTRLEAARHLGWPEGTVAGRLARARAILARRLAKYALGATPAAVAAVFADAANSQGPPPGVLEATRQAVLGTVPLRIAALSNGIVRSMLVRKLQDVSLGLALVVVTGTAVALAVGRPKPDPPSPRAPTIVEQVAVTAAPTDAATALHDRLIGRWQVRTGRQLGLELSPWQLQGFGIEFDVRTLRITRGQIAGDREFTWAVESGPDPKGVMLVPIGRGRSPGVRVEVAFAGNELVLNWDESSRGRIPRGKNPTSQLTLVRQPDEGPAVAGLAVVPAAENVVGSRLVGTWEPDAELSRRLGANAEIKRLEITSDPAVAAQLPAEYRPMFLDKRIYLAGRLKVIGKEETTLPFLLVEHLGNPLVVYFPPSGPAVCGGDESATVMLAPGAKPTDDLLFITPFDGAQHVPVGAYRRVRQELPAKP